MGTSWDIEPDDLGFDPRFAYWFRVQYECIIVFAENLELEFFPFDVYIHIYIYIYMSMQHLVNVS